VSLVAWRRDSLDLGFLKMGWTELGVVGLWVWGAGELDMKVGVDGRV
jgi:hypothetical protein